MSNAVDKCIGEKGNALNWTANGINLINPIRNNKLRDEITYGLHTNRNAIDEEGMDNKRSSLFFLFVSQS